jgi:hypothetical protein
MDARPNWRQSLLVVGLIVVMVWLSGVAFRALERP